MINNENKKERAQKQTQNTDINKQMDVSNKKRHKKI